MASLAPSPDLTARVRTVLRNLFAMACEAECVAMPAKIMLRTQRTTVDRMLGELSDDQAAEMANALVTVMDYVGDKPRRKAALRVVSS